MVWVKWAFVASLLIWAVGGVAIMSSGGTVTFDMTEARPVAIHTFFGGVTLVLGVFLLIRWMWVKLAA